MRKSFDSWLRKRKMKEILAKMTLRLFSSCLTSFIYSHMTMKLRNNEEVNNLILSNAGLTLEL